MARVEREIGVWGTEIFLDVSSSNLSESEINRTISGVEAFFFDVDDELSTFKESSSVTRIRQNKLRMQTLEELTE